MKALRWGIIGMGNMGASHARNILDGRCGRSELSAVCDRNPEALAPFSGVRAVSNPEELVEAPDVDAVLIATQHPTHVDLGRAVLEAGKPLLMEKPLAVHKQEAEILLAAAENRPDLACGIVFNQRTDPRFQKLRGMVRDGELGRIQRIQWTLTDWFRTQSYYRSSYWRATWAGEGGGLLINQCPHNLDLLTWIFGTPRRVQAACQIGGTHDIEVEDAVHAFMEFDAGCWGIFTSTTGEAPGVNRLEVAGEHGLVVLEPGRFQFTRNGTSSIEYIKTATSGFTKPETRAETFAFEEPAGQHAAVVANFAEAVLEGAPLIAPLSSGLASLELGNAMILSHFTGAPVGLPLDGAAYAALLDRLKEASRVPEKGPRQPPPEDFRSSF